MRGNAWTLGGQIARQRRACARPAAAAAPPRPDKAETIDLWPPAIPDLTAYQAEAARLRARAMTDALMAAVAWLRRRRPNGRNRIAR